MRVSCDATSALSFGPHKDTSIINCTKENTQLDLSSEDYSKDFHEDNPNHIHHPIAEELEQSQRLHYLPERAGDLGLVDQEDLERTCHYEEAYRPSWFLSSPRFCRT